jgi:hypothetical protein
MSKIKDLEMPLNENARLQQYVLSLRGKREENTSLLFDLAKEIVLGERNGTN